MQRTSTSKRYAVDAVEVVILDPFAEAKRDQSTLNNFMPNDFTFVQEAKGIPEERDLAPAEALRL